MRRKIIGPFRIHADRRKPTAPLYFSHAGACPAEVAPVTGDAYDRDGQTGKKHRSSVPQVVRRTLKIPFEITADGMARPILACDGINVNVNAFRSFYSPANPSS